MSGPLKSIRTFVDVEKVKAPPTRFTIPGRYAVERYERALTNWRQSIKRRFWYMAAPVAIIFVGFGTLFSLRLEFWIGTVLGAALGILTMLYDTPPEYVSRWAEGAEGEKSTAAALDALRNKGFVTRHDLPKNRGNFDHVVVGPTGVFLVDSKVPSGLVEIHGDDLHVLRSADAEDTYVCHGLGPRVRGAAAELSEEIHRATGVKTYVQALVAIWGRVSEQVVEGDRVTYLHGSELAARIEHNPSTLRPDQYRAVISFFNSISRP